MSEAFTTRYWYTCIVRQEKKSQSTGKSHAVFWRESGYQFGLNPGAACTALDISFRKKNLLIDSIVIRLSSEHGQVLLRTQIDDMTDKLPESKATNVLPWKDIHTPIKKTHESSFDVWKFLTTRTYVHRVIPTLRVKDHMT